jgi:hypothetical protein
MPSVKFLGLIFDSKVSWEPHIWQLRLMCEKTFSILKVFSGSSWGRDRTVLLWLHYAVIHSKIDYIRFIYSSASKSKLSILDPIYSAGICHATGTIHTSCLTSIYAESGEPFHLHSDLLLCSYSAELRAHPHHPSYSVVFCPKLHYRYRMNL